jgi:hypothetical protein
MARNYRDRQNSERLEKLSKIFIEVSAAVPDRLNQLILAEVEKEMEQERVTADLEWLKGATKKELKMVGPNSKQLSKLNHKELGRIICLIEIARKRERASYLVRRFGEDFNNFNIVINDDQDDFADEEEEDDEDDGFDNIIDINENDPYSNFGFVIDADRIHEDMF